jgi:hypothetical protein
VKALILTLAVFAAAPPAPAEELSAQGIVDRALAHNAFGFGDAIARLTLVLEAPGQETRTRTVEIRSAERGAEKRTLVRFHSPADVAGTGFLVIEDGQGREQQFLYMPAIGKVKRITGNQRQQRFMGTDLTYADLEWGSLRRADVRRLADASVGPYATYVLEAKPREDGASYGKTVSWIEKTSFVPLKVEFYDPSGSKLVKTLTVGKLEKRDGRWTAMESVVRDTVAGSSTRMTVTGLDTKAALDPAKLDEQALAGG